jgi:ergothioneine biosynthesis protein EgtB
VDGADVLADFLKVRQQSEALCEPLAIEDYGVQPMDDASPPKWHLAHTTWFFETFVLKPFQSDYRVFHPQFEYLFNSYYNGIGTPFPRPRRGHLSRPTVEEVYDYRRTVDAAMIALLEGGNPEVATRTVLGLNHEQQHQELLLTDLKFNFGHNPLQPAYASAVPAAAVSTSELTFTGYAEGLVEIGVDVSAERTSGDEFCFDNETPRHRVHLDAFSIADRAITCEEYLAFMADGGYRTPSLWLSDGWSWVSANDIDSPLYWTRVDGEWCEYRLTGAATVNGACPVAHVSGYEADAFARWAGYRLPTEAEWETAASGMSGEGNFVESGRFHPAPAGSVNTAAQFFGDVWEWTSTPYGPYPGYEPLAGVLGEYNGKFMSNQLVLRGGSCVTPASHIRPSYRNFFYPPDRWQFSGIRLARNDRS